jgi:hypothetical protein
LQEVKSLEQLKHGGNTTVDLFGGDAIDGDQASFSIKNQTLDLPKE